MWAVSVQSKTWEFFSLLAQLICKVTTLILATKKIYILYSQSIDFKNCNC